MSDLKPTILFIEDEISLLNQLSRELERKGYEVLGAKYPDDAIELIKGKDHIDFLITDLRLPMEGCKSIDFLEAGGGKSVGLALAKEFRKKFRRAPIIFWSGAYDREIRNIALKFGNSRLIPKSGGADPVLDFIDDALDGFRSAKRPKTFIVHGHDDLTLKSFKNFLEVDLRFPKPIILCNEPSDGQTIIEKIESYTSTIDVVFVLLTPDDMVSSANSQGRLYRARQNVIFEMGFFLGILGRDTGRVILLYRDPIEPPSDISGMICINITDGIEKASSEIKQELREWLRL